MNHFLSSTQLVVMKFEQIFFRAKFTSLLSKALPISFKRGWIAWGQGLLLFLQKVHSCEAKCWSNYSWKIWSRMRRDGRNCTFLGKENGQSRGIPIYDVEASPLYFTIHRKYDNYDRINEMQMYSKKFRVGGSAHIIESASCFVQQKFVTKWNFQSHCTFWRWEYGSHSVSGWGINCWNFFKLFFWMPKINFGNLAFE